MAINDSDETTSKVTILPTAKAPDKDPIFRTIDWEKVITVEDLTLIVRGFMCVFGKTDINILDTKIEFDIVNFPEVERLCKEETGEH